MAITLPQGLDRPRRRPSGRLLAGLAALGLSAALPGPALAASAGSAWSFKTTRLSPPKLAVTTPAAGTGSGLIFTAPFKNFAVASPVVGQPGALIADNRGNPVWFQAAPAGQTDANFKAQSYQGKPVLTFWQGVISLPGNTTGVPPGAPEPGATYRVLDQHYQLIRTVSGQNGWTAGLHEFTITPQGTAIYVVDRTVPADLTPYGGSASGQYEDSGIQEVDLTTGKVVFQWDMADHVPLGQSFDPPPAKGTWDPFHINSIELGPGGDLLVSARETWSIYDIRHDAGGAVNWILDSKPAATDSTFSFGTGADFSWQHDARFRPNGEISLFDDHCCDLSVKSTTPPPTARGLVLKLDNTARTATMVHSYSRSPGLVVATQGNMQNLSNGNEFIGWGQAPVISEYSAAGRLVYEAQLPAADESYRTYRLPWSGLPSSKPAVKLIRHGARSTIYVSWNGATQVARWAVLAGATKGKLTLVKRVAKTGFETTIHVKLGQRRYLQIQALGATVQALASSAIKRVPAAPSRSNSTLQAHRASATVLGTEKVSNFGPVLAAASGHVLYEFDVDTRNRSHCTGRCTNTWQPFLASGSVTVKSGSGLKPKLVGRLKLPSGRYQVSYNGHPLYLYAKDRRAGQLNGQAKYQFGGDWYVLGPKGRAIACTPGLVCGY